MRRGLSTGFAGVVVAGLLAWPGMAAAATQRMTVRSEPSQRTALPFTSVDAGLMAFGGGALLLVGGGLRRRGARE